MRWRGRGGSRNVEDRRGMRGPILAGGGIGGLLLLIAALVFGVDPGALMDAGGAGAPAGVEPGEPTDEAGRFVAVVLAETDSTWDRIFADVGEDYPEPTLVLFSGAVQSACGMAGTAVGPFYCPLDGKVYIDLAFYDDLRDRLGAPGDFAEAYVIAHEVGHHVQNVTGTADRVREAQSRATEAERNELSVRMELQADCYAGVFARDALARGLLEPGDVEEALGAAAAIGDDRLQREAQGYVVPESFTHGTSEQRARWFRRGLDTGDPATCDTFAG